MKEQNSILDKGISLWWEKLRDDIKQSLCREYYMNWTKPVSELQDNQIQFIYDCECRNKMKAKNSTSILETAALLWWDSLKDYQKQARLISNNFTGTIVTDGWKAKCYNAEHPSKPLLESPTDNKVEEGGFYFEKHKLTINSGMNAGDYLDKEDFVKYAEIMGNRNAKLLSDVKVLRDALGQLMGMEAWITDRKMKVAFQDIVYPALDKTSK